MAASNQPQRSESEKPLSPSEPRPKRSIRRRIIRSGAWLIRSKYTIGSLVAIYNPAGCILLVRQRLYDTHSWTLPGGLIKPSERPHETAIRETREEIGWTLDIGETDEVAHYKQHWAHHVDVLYIHTLAEPRDVETHSITEIADARWFDITNDEPVLSAEAVVAINVLKGQRPPYLQLFWWGHSKPPGV